MQLSAIFAICLGVGFGVLACDHDDSSLAEEGLNRQQTEARAKLALEDYAACYHEDSSACEAELSVLSEGLAALAQAEEIAFRASIVIMCGDDFIGCDGDWCTGTDEFGCACGSGGYFTDIALCPASFEAEPDHSKEQALPKK